MPDLDLGEIENRFAGAASAATTAVKTAFDRAFEDNPLTAPDLGLTEAAIRALESANVYRGAARDLAEGARAPLESWQALRDAVRGTDEASVDALTEATAAAERLETALGDAGRAATGAGASAGAAAAAAEPATEAAVTAWQAVTAALSDYASKARDIGGEIGQSLVGAFQSAENAVGQFVRTGKLNFRDLVTSLLADLAQLAARRFILVPIANALSGVFAGAGGIFANVLHAGWMVGSAGPSRMVPAMAFAAAPRMHGGGMAGLRHDEVPAILQRGERVLSRREAQSYGAGGGVNVTIMARDAESFRQSRTQVVADFARSWLGTPYHDQASLRGVGCDCLGLARGVWREVVVPEPFPIPPYSRDWGETGPREVLAEGARAMMIEVEPAAAGPGALVLFCMKPSAIAKHVGILTGPGAFLHAYERLGVIEEPLTPSWWRRIAFAFLFPQR